MSGYITPKGTSYPAPQRTPASKAATGSLWFAISILLANLIMTMIWAMVDSAASVSAAVAVPAAVWIVEAIRLLIGLTLFSFALVLGVRGLRETAGGAIRGRGWAIAGIIVASSLLLFSLVDITTELEVSFLH